MEIQEVKYLTELSDKARHKYCVEVGGFISQSDTDISSAGKLADHYAQRGMEGVIYETRVFNERKTVADLLKEGKKFL